MGLTQVRAYLRAWNRDEDILEMDASTATVPLAAAALGVEEARIAKSISLRNGEGALVLVVDAERGRRAAFYRTCRRRGLSVRAAGWGEGLSRRIYAALYHRFPRMRHGQFGDRAHSPRAYGILPLRKMGRCLQAARNTIKFVFGGQYDAIGSPCGR